MHDAKVVLSLMPAGTGELTARPDPDDCEEEEPRTLSRVLFRRGQRIDFAF